MKDEKKIDRRTVLKGGLTAVAGGALLGAASRVQGGAQTPPPPSPELHEGEIPRRPYGKTGVTLPMLGMGGSAMVNYFAGGYGVELDPVEQRPAMVRHAFDSGIRYFDTARVYFESESIVGKGLKGVRDQAFIATKVAEPDPAKVRASVETSLRELDTDYVDLIQVHSPVTEAVGVPGALKVHDELVKLRDEKMVRFIGLTTHVAFEDVNTLIQTDRFDQVMLAYGYFPKGMDTMLSSRNLEFRNQCLANAHQRGMAIVAMKVMGASILGHNARNLVPDYRAGDLAKLPGAAIRWVLQDERIAMLNIGVSMPSDIDRNLAILKGRTRFTDEDRLLLADFALRAYDAPAVKEMQTT